MLQTLASCAAVDTVYMVDPVLVVLGVKPNVEAAAVQAVAAAATGTNDAESASVTGVGAGKPKNGAGGMLCGEQPVGRNRELQCPMTYNNA